MKMKKIIASFLVGALVLGLSFSADAKSIRPYDDKRVVYLSFDDGPNEYTPALLDVLKKYRVKATFFVKGPEAKEHPDILKRIVKEGHAIGLHSMTHDKEKFYATPTSAVKEMKEVQAIVYEITKVKTNIVRVPYGSVPHMTKAHRVAMEKAGFKMWDWNVDSLDWKYVKSQHLIVRRTLAIAESNYNKNQPSIILMHDHSTGVVALDKTVRTLKHKGLSFRTMKGVSNPYNFFNKWKAKTQRQ